MDGAAVVAAWFARDGVRWSEAAMATALDDRCAAGERAVCALRGSADPAEPLGALCDAGDGLACLGAAWASLPAGPTGLDPAHPPAPARYRAQVDRACALGVARGCTELGETDWYGIATYADRHAAIDRWTKLCAAGERHACTRLGTALGVPAAVERGRSLGDPEATLWIARRDADPEALAAACAAGLTEACFDTAVALVGTDPAAARAAADSACALGDAPSCVLAIRVDAVSGARPIPQVIDALGAFCPRVDAACEERAFLEQGAAPVLAYPGTIHPTDLRSHLSDLTGPLFACEQVALANGDTLAGEPRLRFRVEPDGHVLGVYVPQVEDLQARQCVVEAVRGHRARDPVGGVARVDVTHPLFHGAKVDVSAATEAADSGLDLHEVALDTPRWAGPLDRCLLEHGHPEPGVRMVVTLEAGRTGDIRDVRVERSTEEPEVDRCVVEWLEQHTLATPPTLRTQVRATVRFIQRWDEDPGTSGRRVRPAPVPLVGPAPETPVRMRVLVAERSEIDGRRGKLGRTSIDSITEVHRDLAEFVREHTHGRVDLQVEVVVVDTTLAPTGGGEGYDRWNVSPYDLTAELLAQIPDDTDSVFLYVPIPRGYPQPALGVTWMQASVGGATFSSLALGSNRAVYANPGAPPFELPLHEWWHQMEARAEHLGVDVPQNHDVLRVDGYAFDPRTWLSESPTVMEWYDQVLGYEVHPQLWRDAWAPGLLDGRWNLAANADGPAVVSDGLTSDGGFGLGVTGAPVELRWSKVVNLGEVVVHLAVTSGPASIRVRGGDVTQTVPAPATGAVKLPLRAVGDALEIEVVAGEATITEVEVYEAPAG